ncbi:DNA-directed RNA polymerase subunit H [Candidatus Woesearchaeota archaeon]|jgi:DNA-directed RNA polymerase subunit H|nr:DNA-directed RNA polymerase subunit H [Candidatus Woesearchaeota archaeon]MBT4387841.1 DNA-directed RNA polymerase subunit H [Candidatus Woesearchaeota archaeon]MBT4595660.1 DNA-directed RNA polymerase subunit H [Candidatus Woesearchaeota archaeon]MBT5740857.1 DNA-directed RNA polymerase subunit H [Candidatus Woesearchaeota archaeon]MBT6505606.1 DNA-directed RNA polymerase subunit H [Candidatus Woesearchaeota archaeon]
MAKKTKHFLIPEHILLSDDEKKKMFDEFNIGFSQLPSINFNDPALEDLGANPGDVIKIVRESKTDGISLYYRGVSNE